MTDNYISGSCSILEVLDLLAKRCRTRVMVSVDQTWAVARRAFLALAAALGFLPARPVDKHLDVRRTRITAMGLTLAGAAILLVRQFD